MLCDQLILPYCINSTSSYLWPCDRRQLSRKETVALWWTISTWKRVQLRFSSLFSGPVSIIQSFWNVFVVSMCETNSSCSLGVRVAVSSVELVFQALELVVLYCSLSQCMGLVSYLNTSSHAVMVGCTISKFRTVQYRLYINSLQQGHSLQVHWSMWTKNPLHFF